MAEVERPADRAGTWRDWPAWVIAVGVLLGVVALLSGGRPTLVVWLVIAFGVVALLMLTSQVFVTPILGAVSVLAALILVLVVSVFWPRW